MPTMTDPRPHSDKAPWFLLAAFAAVMAFVSLIFFAGNAWNYPLP